MIMKEEKMQWCKARQQANQSGITLTRRKNKQGEYVCYLYGWSKHRGHRTNWLSDVKRRGWISQTMAHDFAEYCGYELV